MYLLKIKVSENGGRGMTKKEREAHFISYINPNNLPYDNLPEYITKCSNCGCGLSNVAFYCPICGVKINERVVHARDNSIIIYPSWIPVSERLPEKHDCYLVTTKWKGSYSGDVYIETNMAVFREKPKEWDCAGVIAWMPLPEPYTESEEDK